MKKISIQVIALAVWSTCWSTIGEHTDNEKLSVARNCLLRAMTIHAKGLRYRESTDGAYSDTWYGFMGPCNEEWTLADKQASFDLYLTTLSTNNCMTMTTIDQNIARTAVAQCEILDYTNAIPSLTALVLNSNGIHKTMAISYILKASPVSPNATDFVETIITNVNAYTYRERVYAIALYSEKICATVAAEGVGSVTVQNAAQMFYRNRTAVRMASSAVDRVLVSSIPGFEMSSNRLDMAISTLSETNIPPVFVEYFTTVTNQLLSSGQPLPWINVGNGGN